MDINEKCCSFTDKSLGIVLNDIQEDFIKMRGTPTLTLFDRDGKVIKTYTSHNLIVKVGRSSIIKMLSAGGVANNITKCEVGTGGVNVPPADQFAPIAPIDSDTALYHEVLASMTNINSYSYDDPTTPTMVTFVTLFTSSIVNNIVSEAGLFLSNGVLFARYTFPSMYLRNDKGYSLQISWQIQF